MHNRFLNPLCIAAVIGCAAVGLTAVLAPPARAAFPGEAGWIVFASDAYTGPAHGSKANWNIWKLDPATYDADRGRPLTRLTDNEQNELSPSFSPDGGKIVYVVDRGRDSEVMLMNADGTDKKQLTDNSSKDRQPVFSPDGTRIAFASSRSGETEIWVMRADGSGKTRLSDFSKIDKTTGKSANPQFSPDGSEVFFQGTTYANTAFGHDALFAVDSDAVKPEHPRLLWSLDTWVDMRGFAFNATGTRFISSIRLSTEKDAVRQFATGGGIATAGIIPSWGPRDIWRATADGGCGFCGKNHGLQVFHRFYGDPDKRHLYRDHYSPAYSPAGNKFVYQLHQPGDPGSAYRQEPAPSLGLVGAEGEISGNRVCCPLQIDGGPANHWAQIQPDWGPNAHLPAVTTGWDRGVDQTSGTLQGTVNPAGRETKYHFEYGRTEAYGKSTPVQSAGNGISDVQVSADISGLTPAATYHYRLVASNDKGTTHGSDKTFTTSGGCHRWDCPAVTTTGAASVTLNSAMLRGTVNPAGFETEYHFEYGRTADYGKSTPVQSAGNGISDVQVSADISGLIRATTYHYRLVATNGYGTAYGSDANFTTKGCEQVRTC